jgi:hypothetical protein
MEISLYQVVAFLGFAAIFGVMIYGAEKSMPKKPKYVRVNKYTSEYHKYVPVR